MIAIRLRFPAGRYHATPWGRHVNEAALAWPPEPVRILRALIACHYRKADKTRFSADALGDLIDVLAEELPVYRLPDAVQAHTRHFMPSPIAKTLVFDTFACFDPEEPMMVGWPAIILSGEQRMHLDHLAARLGYLGRAESWAEAEVIEWDGADANALPVRRDMDSDTEPRPDQQLVRLHASLSPDSYRQRRQRLIEDERMRRRAAWTKKTKLTDASLDKDMKDFLATLPERLVSALSVDTSEIHAVGWSDPPATRHVVYAAPEVASVWRDVPRRRTVRSRPDPTVARFVLAGRPRPRVEDTVRIAEIMRWAAMAKFDWETVDGKSRPRAPSVISGYGEDGKPLRDGGHHSHAFWLPEDADDDGEIDHVVVYAAGGLNEECRSRLDQVTHLWLSRHRHSEEEEPADSGRKEWRLALEGFGGSEDFASASRLFGHSRKWRSVTPYLMPWYAKKAFGWVEQIGRELEERGLPKLSEAPQDVGSICIRGRKTRAIQFHRFRSRHGLRQPDTLGRFVELTFEEPLVGPLALGFGCHFGLGLFRPLNAD